MPTFFLIVDATFDVWNIHQFQLWKWSVMNWIIINPHWFRILLTCLDPPNRINLNRRNLKTIPVTTCTLLVKNLGRHFFQRSSNQNQLKKNVKNLKSIISLFSLTKNYESSSKWSHTLNRILQLHNRKKKKQMSPYH